MTGKYFLCFCKLSNLFKSISRLPKRFCRRQSFMAKRALLLLVFFALQVLSQDTSEWLSIDCGSTFPYQIGDIYWRTDDGFIKTGMNRQVSPSNYTDLSLLNSLRVFTKQNKNCYTLPASEGTRYFIRTTFHYGNYDGASQPPTFDLEIDGNRWLTILSSSLTDPVYHEIIYTSKGDSISVCLARTHDKQLPFISSLEVWPIPDTMYPEISKDLAWFSSQRLNYGAEDWILGYPLDVYNRIWEPALPPKTVRRNITTVIRHTVYEDPPISAILDAVESPGLRSPLLLDLESSKTKGTNYILAYFTEMDILQINETRSFNISVNGTYLYTTSPQYQNCSGVWAIIPQSGPVITLELTSTAESTLPPIISAIEVYAASDPLVTIGTSTNDMDGLAVFINTFDELNGWSGEPCLPNDTAWEWLGCTGVDPPRVTSLHLSGYALKGPLPDFSQMQALHTIDLSSNSLNGLIPEFLGQLPDLRLLNLDYNDFYGNVPDSIISNKKIKFQVHGNPRLNYHPKGSKRMALIIGLAVGLPVAIILLIVALVYFLRRKHKLPSQDQLAAPESGLSQAGEASAQERPEEGSASTSVNMVPLTKPLGNNRPETEGEEISTSICVESTNHPTRANGSATPIANAEVYPSGQQTYQESMVPDMDMEELDQLLQQHEIASANRRA